MDKTQELILEMIKDIKIYRWHDESCLKEEIDTNNVYHVCEWCKQYHKYHAVNDTGDVIHRLNIGLYQLIDVVHWAKADVNKICSEWSEAIASCFIHCVGAYENLFENNTVSCIATPFLEDFGYFSNALKFYESDVAFCQLWNKHPKELIEKLYYSIPFVLQQFHYKFYNRKRRFNEPILRECFGKNIIAILLILNESSGNALPFKDGLKIAMNKLQDCEFKRH